MPFALLPSVDGHVRTPMIRRVSVTDWLFGVIIVGFVAVLCLGAAVGGLDLSTRESRAYALIVSLVMGVGFFVLADAWIGIGFPVAVLVFILSGLSRDTKPSTR